MKKSKILRDFMRFSDLKLDAFAANVSLSLTANVNFPDPSIPMVQLDAGRSAYSIALAAAKNRDLLKLSLKNDAKAKLRELLSVLAYYVESVAKGDRSILISSGFNVSAESASSNAVTSVKNFRVRNGHNSGEMILSVSRMIGFNYSFYFGYMDGNTMVWDHITDTKSKMTITKLQVGRAYTFYVKANGGKEKYLQSESITKVVS